MSNPFESESRSVMWPDAPEPRHSVPCYHCGGDHVEWACSKRWHIEDDLCPICSEETYGAINGMRYCEDCGLIDD